jgi:RHH-type transcriptional regulator, rel operon repressor / antitoxin RelB
MYTLKICKGLTMTMLAIRLPESIEKRLTHLAETTGRTKTFYAREAIMEHIDDLEDQYLAIHRLEHPTVRISHADVERDLELDH